MNNERNISDIVSDCSRADQIHEPRLKRTIIFRRSTLFKTRNRYFEKNRESTCEKKRKVYHEMSDSTTLRKQI